MRNDRYLPRIVDDKVSNLLKVAGAISIVGPKWCGKSWTAKFHGNSLIELDRKENIDRAKVSLEYILNLEKPEVIDEWNAVPEVWDEVRHKCDEDDEKGKYILTCSTKLDEDDEKKIFHSGAGRIIELKMHTMSLYESKDSTGDISLMDMYNNINITRQVKKTSISDLCYFIIRGGWPGNINVDKKNANILPKSYIESVLNKDIKVKINFDKNKMLLLMKSLARNESTIVSIQTLINDIEDYENNKELTLSKITINSYLDVLESLHLIENQDSFSVNLRSKNRVGKACKRHFTDVSIAASLLNLTIDKLANDVETLGFLYEALVERDLRIYIEALNGKIYHFRNNTTQLEVDAILEFEDGEYAACEIKLGAGQIGDAISNLKKFYDSVNKKPKFMCVIVGTIDMIYRDNDTGIYILPITALK